MVVDTPETTMSIQPDTMITGFLIVQRADGAVSLIASASEFESLGLPILQEPKPATIRSLCTQVHEELLVRYSAIVAAETLLSFEQKDDNNE